ncbi:MAG: hypothetical protein LC796_12920 [Acidobacteria bacterium]|nr:hypothetical protein [Acidobacteriota bacterium]
MTAAREIRLERLVGREVRDQTGRAVGRLEEVRARKKGNEWVVTDCHIGTAALVERLAAHILRFGTHGYRASWDQIDWSDPEKLRLACPLEDLRRLTSRAARSRRK